MDLLSEIKKIPPVTRYLCLATAGVTGAVQFRMLDLYWIHYHATFVLKKRQIWRIYSSFLVGQSRLSSILDLMMLYRALNDLESHSYKHRSSDLAYQLMWVAPTILAITQSQNPCPQKALLLSIIYLHSRLFPTKTTSITGLGQVPIIYLPHIMIAFDLLTEGKREAKLGIVGCVVGHIWWWMVWGGDSFERGNGAVSARAFRAPEWLRRWMGEELASSG